MILLALHFIGDHLGQLVTGIVKDTEALLRSHPLHGRCIMQQYPCNNHDQKYCHFHIEIFFTSQFLVHAHPRFPVVNYTV